LVENPDFSPPYVTTPPPGINGCEFYAVFFHSRAGSTPHEAVQIDFLQSPLPTQRVKGVTDIQIYRRKSDLNSAAYYVALAKNVMVVTTKFVD